MKHYDLFCISKENLDAIYLSLPVEVAMVTRIGQIDSNSCLLSARKTLLKRGFRILGIKECESIDIDPIQNAILTRVAELNCGLDFNHPNTFAVTFDYNAGTSEVCKGEVIVHSLPEIQPMEILIFLLAEGR